MCPEGASLSHPDSGMALRSSSPNVGQLCTCQSAKFLNLVSPCKIIIQITQNLNIIGGSCIEHEMQAYPISIRHQACEDDRGVVLTAIDFFCTPQHVVRRCLVEQKGMLETHRVPVATLPITIHIPKSVTCSAAALISFDAAR